MAARLICTSLFLVSLLAPAAADEVNDHDQATLREANVGLDGPALLNFFRQRTPTEEQRKEIAELIRQLGSDSFQVRRKAAQRVESFGLTAVGMLKQSLTSQDPETARQCELVLRKVEKVPTEIVAASAARMLGRVKPDGALEVILAQLPSADDDQVADALRWALVPLAVRNGKPEPRLFAALSDRDPTRRAAAAEALIKGKATGAEAEVRKLLRDENGEVRLRTALALVTAGRHKDVVPELIGLLVNGPAEHTWEAEEVLRHLAGSDAPSLSAVGDADARTRARDAWADWWKRKGKDVSLARLDEAPPTLNYTLVLQMTPNGGEGQVREFAPDLKTVRWQIRNLQLPIDAQFLPGANRLLVAEYNAGTVTERDLDGKVQRRWSIAQPIGCQRTAEGNTLIVYRNGLIEYGPKDEKVFSHERNLNDIVSGRKARDGTYVFVTRGGQCVQMNAKGKALKTFAIGPMYFFGSLELLPNNRILVTQQTGAAEYDLATGKLEWSMTGSRNSTSATRLPNGNTLLSSTLLRKIIEYDRRGKAVKEFQLPDGSVPWRATRR